MFASKLLFGFSLYLIYKFSNYFYEIVKDGFPSWDDDLVIGNTTINLVFAPYGSILAIMIALVLLYVSGKDLYLYYFSNTQTNAKVLNIEHSTEDTSESAPINIIIEIEGIAVTLDFLNSDLRKQVSIGGTIPVRYFSGKPEKAVLDESKISY